MRQERSRRCRLRGRQVVRFPQRGLEFLLQAVMLRLPIDQFAPVEVAGAVRGKVAELCLGLPRGDQRPAELRRAGPPLVLLGDPAPPEKAEQ